MNQILSLGNSFQISKVALLFILFSAYSVVAKCELTIDCASNCLHNKNELPCYKQTEDDPLFSVSQNCIYSNHPPKPFMVSGLYKPMAIEGANWIYKVKDDGHISYYGWRIEGDTTINQVNYKKGFGITVNHLVAPPNQALVFSIEDYSSPDFFMRDDTILKKVYAIYPNLVNEYNCQPISNVDEEVLIYDFAPNIDESIYCPNEQYIVTDIDTVEYFEYTVPRNHINQSERIQYQQIGDPNGLFTDINTFWVASFDIELIEYCVNSEIGCPHSLGPLATNEIEDNSSVTLYPNPAFDKITISAATTIHYIDIYTIDGRRIQGIKGNGSQDLEVSLQEPTSQILIALIKLEDGSIVRKLFAKN